MKSYSKLRHIKNSNLILERRFLAEEPSKLTGLAKRLGEITGIPEEVFKYFDTKENSDLKGFDSFISEVGKKIETLSQENVKN